MKLTEPQYRTLARMSDGEEVWTTGGMNSSAFWHNDMCAKPPSHATLHALSRASLIENYETALGHGGKYRITPAGRQALATSKGGER